MKRSKELVEKRKDFVIDYVKRNQDKQMKVIVTELTEMLFLSERTIYNILLQSQFVNSKTKFSLIYSNKDRKGFKVIILLPITNLYIRLIKGWFRHLSQIKICR